jgi:prepilin signal peptidase PulO-like enzyme (type II secretory pathway)
METIVLVSGIIGLAVGSFLNVVIFRSGPAFSGAEKRGRIRFGGRSFCPSCKKELQWFELIPLASFAIQKRRCRGCAGLISWQYPAVELGTAAAFALIAWQYIGGVLVFP